MKETFKFVCYGNEKTIRLKPWVMPMTKPTPGPKNCQRCNSTRSVFQNRKIITAVGTKVLTKFNGKANRSGTKEVV
jgi:hypothetical protein